MEQNQTTTSRKKFLVWGTAVFTSLTALKIFTSFKKVSHTKPATVKMLTQDGKLVEVETDRIYCGKRKKISDEQLKKWVKKNQHNTQG